MFIFLRSNKVCQRVPEVVDGSWNVQSGSQADRLAIILGFCFSKFGLERSGVRKRGEQVKGRQKRRDEQVFLKEALLFYTGTWIVVLLWSFSKEEGRLMQQ